MADAAGTYALNLSRLATRVVGSRIVHFEEIDSTNDAAARIGGDGTVVTADRQTAGRGRHGRPWHSIPGKGLYMSIAFAGDQPGAAFFAPLAVRNACRPICPLTVKWPNDLLHEGRKLCGVLVEQKMGHTILGIGVNVNHTIDDFPEDLRGYGASLRLASGRELDRNAVLRDILMELDRLLAVVREGGLDAVRTEWAEACAIAGRRIRHARVEGVVREVNSHGGLTVVSDDGVHQVVFGDVIELDGR